MTFNIADNGFTALELLDKMTWICPDGYYDAEMDGFEAFKIIRDKKRYQECSGNLRHRKGGYRQCVRDLTWSCGLHQKAL
jgi:hypothetical protein